jgi:hypothetical protein
VSNAVCIAKHVVIQRLSERANFQALERVKGIEPSSSAWKAVALPLSYTRIAVHHTCNRTAFPDNAVVVGEVGLEPTKA